MSDPDRSSRGESPDDRVDLPAGYGRPTEKGRRRGKLVILLPLLVIAVIVSVLLLVTRCGSSVSDTGLGPSAPAAESAVPGSSGGK